MEWFFPACTLCLMFVKPPRERLLMPQYHLADRSTQRKNKSMKWHPEEGGPWKAPRSSIDWQDKERQWLILLYTSSIELIQSPPHCLFNMQRECQTGGRTMCFWKKGKLAGVGWTTSSISPKKKLEILANVKPIRRGWMTGQKTTCEGENQGPLKQPLRIFTRSCPGTNQVQNHFYESGRHSASALI